MSALRLILMSLFALGLEAGAAVRLAVWTGDAEVRPAADLLTAGLSRDTNVVMLERTEIERVVQEQARGNQGRDVVQAGRLLGADGLCLLELVKTAETNLLVARFVAVKPGVNLGTVMQPWPVADPNGWAQTVQGRLGRLLPKFQVARTNAVPISIVNVRYALDSAAGRTLERELSSLLALRLMNEQGLFVLERRRLGELAWEKELAGVNDQPFWNGSWLLEGGIEPVTGRPEVLSVNLQLTRPDAAHPVKIVATGARTNLMGLVESLVSQMLAELRVSPAAPAWNAAVEAANYFSEAQWAWRWGMGDEALVALENCWALGRQTDEVAYFRLEALQSLAAPIYTWNTVNDRRVTPSPVDPVRLGRLRQTVDFLEDQRLRRQTRGLPPDEQWVKIESQVLEVLSRTLEHIHGRFRDRIQLKLDAQALEFQVVARALHSRLQSDIATLPEAVRPALQGRLNLIYVQYVSFWHASPDSLAADFRPAIARGFDGAQLTYLLGRIGNGQNKTRMYPPGQAPESPDEPVLFAWEPEDRRQVAAFWGTLKGELLASTNANARLCGHILKLNSLSMADIPAAVTAAHQAITSPLDGDFYHDLDRSSLDVLLNLVRSGPPYPSKETRAEREALAQHQMSLTFGLYLATAASYNDETLRREIDQVHPGREDARSLLKSLDRHYQRLGVKLDRGPFLGIVESKLVGGAGFSFDEILEFLRGSKADEPMLFQCLLLLRQFTPEEMKQLKPAMDEYVRRFPGASVFVEKLLTKNLIFKVPYERAFLPPPPPTLPERVQARIAYLDRATNYNEEEFHFNVASERLPPDLARTLLPHLEKYQERMGARPEVVSYLATIRACALTLEELQKYLAGATNVESEVLQQYFISRRLTTEEAMALLPSFRAYHQRVGEHAMVSAIEVKLREYSVLGAPRVAQPPPPTIEEWQAALKARADFLDQATAYDEAGFMRWFNSVNWDAREAQQLLSHLQDYQRRFGNPPAVARQEVKMRAAAITVEALKEHFKTATQVDTPFLGSAVMLRKFTPAEAAELAALVPQFRERVGASPFLNVVEKRLREQAAQPTAAPAKP